MGKFDGIFRARGIKGGVEVGLPGGIVWEAGEGGDVLVGSAEEEHVDGNLSARALDGERLVEGGGGLQEAGFLLCRKRA